MPVRQRALATAETLGAAFGDQPFRLAAATSAGVSRERIDAAVRAGYLVRLRHGVLVAARALETATTPQARHRLDALALMCALPPRSSGRPAPRALSHTSGALLNGLPYPGLRCPPTWPVEVTTTQRSGPAPTGWRRHCAALPAHHVVERHGHPTTSIARTAVDIAATRPFCDALLVVDAALAMLVRSGAYDDPTDWRGDRELLRDPRLISAARDDLRLTWAETGRSRGGRRVEMAIAAGDPAAENPFESASRAAVLLAGLPRPDVGYPVVGADGRTYWADLAWPELGVLGEADGRGKYTDSSVLYAEKLRQEALERAGWIVVRWTWSELVFTPDLVVARIAAALDRARQRRRSA